jgi:hypothetical protein
MILVSVYDDPQKRAKTSRRSERERYLHHRDRRRIDVFLALLWAGERRAVWVAWTTWALPAEH